VFGAGFPEWGFLAVVPLLFWALVLAALYWAVRTGVRHGLADAQRRLAPPSDPPAQAAPHGGE
jgi:hypothetical protein